MSMARAMHIGTKVKAAERKRIEIVEMNCNEGSDFKIKTLTIHRDFQLDAKKSDTLIAVCNAEDRRR